MRFCKYILISRNIKATAGAGRLTVMAYVDNNPAEMIQWLNEHLTPGRDKLQLVRAQACDKSGRLSVASRRILANARLSADPKFKIEEKTYKETLMTAMTTVSCSVLLTVVEMPLYAKS